MYLMDRAVWTLVGVAIGVVVGYLLRGFQDVRRAAEHAETAAYEAAHEAHKASVETHEMKEAMHRNEDGYTDTRAALVMLIVAILVSAMGVVTGFRSISRADCLAEYNTKFRQAYIARVDANDEATAAADKDREALDTAIVTILAATEPDQSRQALQDYLESRAESNASRTAAAEARAANPYPLPPECK